MVVISTKKLKGNGVYFVGGNADDVTGSCIYIKFNNKQILLECGLVQDNDYLSSYKINSQKFKFNPKEIDYVFIAHCHADHSALLPRLVKQGFNGTIITTHASALLMKKLLLNSCFILEGEANTLSRIYHRTYVPLYDEQDVFNTLDLIREYDESNVKYILDEVVSFEWINNSHCLGAKQLRLNLTDDIGITKHILYTSDLGALKSNNHYVDKTEIDYRHYDLAIMESTYGEASRANKKDRQFDTEHLRVAAETVLERGGTLLLPCFSFSRTQEILTTLYELFGNTDFGYDVIVDSKLSCEICDLYDYLTDDPLWKRVRNWGNVKFISDKSESLGYVKSHNPKIVISSSGFCTNGRVLSYLHEYLKDHKSMVVFSGYAGSDNSYLSYRIKNYKDNKILKISGDAVENNADCISLTTFSSHMNHDDLVEFGSELNTNKLVLVHGSHDAKSNLKEDLKKAISKKDKSFKVVSSVKDMVIHL